MTVLTGVGAVFSAAHEPKGGGPMHGHTWEVIVWLPRCDAVAAQAALQKLLSQVDHGVLPDAITQGEDIAVWIGNSFRVRIPDGSKPSGIRLLDPVRVQVNRPLERIYAEWSR